MRSLMKVALPVARDAFARPGHRLIGRMVGRWREGWAGGEVVRPVVVEPVLSRLETPDDCMARLASVLRRVLRGRLITAPDVPALGATTQMKPPASRGLTFLTTGAGRLHSRIDHRLGHVASLA